MSTEENVSVITPMVEYENETIWEDKVLIMIHNLSDVINKTISNDDYDYKIGNLIIRKLAAICFWLGTEFNNGLYSFWSVFELPSND